MDSKMNDIVERSVFKRPLESVNDSSDNVLKKPALVNPLQEVTNSAVIQKPTPAPEEKKEEEKVETVATFQQIIDEHDRDSQLYFSPYAQRIVNSWLKVEDKYRCLPNFLEGQNDIKSYMREKLIDWIVEVNNRLHNRRETLYLCVNIIDRYVATSIKNKTDVITRSNYQLVGVTSYFIASKYEEIYYTELHNLLPFTDNVFREEEVKQMEIKIINALNYELTVPTTNKFLNRYLRLTSNKSLHFMCYFICDRMLQSITMLQWKPSVQAAAAFYLARKYLGYEECWNKNFEEFTGVKKSSFIQCAIAIHGLIMNPNKLQACARKYQSSRFNQIYNCIPQKHTQN